MKNDTIVFVTHVSYLDGAIEHIRMASKQHTDFNVVITITPKQVFQNILDLRHVNLDEYGPLVDFEMVQNEWKLQLLTPYFKNCKSIRFLIFKEKGTVNAISTMVKFNRYINGLKPRYIHLDSYVNRQIFQLPFLYRNRKKTILNVHDAKPHSGEEDKVRLFSQRRLYKWCHKFVTFSNFSKNQLLEQVSPEKKVVNSFLLPFSYYTNFIDSKNDAIKKPKYISFVGRVSRYKGIDLFIDSINLIHERFPETEFVIAGKSFAGYVPDFDKINSPERVTILQEHLSNNKMVDIIISSQLIVCPYLDASQSGVVVTAAALKRPVLVTEAGGLKEYISEGANGMVCEINAKDLAFKIIDFCEKNGLEKMGELMNTAKYNMDIEEEYLSALADIYN